MSQQITFRILQVDEIDSGTGRTLVYPYSLYFTSINAILLDFISDKFPWKSISIFEKIACNNFS